MTLIWLDDIRDPFKPPFSSNIEEILFDDLYEIKRDFKVVWVKNYDEFVSEVKNVFPAIISFDHDLAFEHLTGEKTEEKTGYDCAKWLVDYCIDNKIPLPEFNVHSQNPVGKQNILSLLNNFKKWK